MAGLVVLTPKPVNCIMSATTAKLHVSDGSFLMFTRQDRIIRARILERAVRESDLRASKRIVKGQVFLGFVVLDFSGPLNSTAEIWFW